MDLPEPVGPVIRMMPLGRCSSASIFFCTKGSIWSFARLNFSWLSRRRETLSPSTVGTVATRTSMVGAFELQVDPAVLRDPALGDVETRHDFQTRDHRALQRLDVFRHRHLDQAAVDPVADAQVGGQRLDVDVGRALVERLADDLVDELDDAGLLVVVLVDDVRLVLAGLRCAS